MRRFISTKTLLCRQNSLANHLLYAFPKECAGVRFFHIKLLQHSQQATTNCHMLLLLPHSIHTHLVTPRSLSRARSIPEIIRDNNNEYATDNEKQLFCQRLNYWEFLFFSYKCSLTQFSFSFQIFFVVLKRTDWLIFLWNYTMVCILLLFHSIIPFEII